MKKLSLWIREFGESYDVPNKVTDTLHDISWRNDQCPSFSRLESDIGPRLWVDHPDPELRREPGVARFLVSDLEQVYHVGDDLDAALVALENATREQLR
jgi:hypothetical protein